MEFSKNMEKLPYNLEEAEKEAAEMQEKIKFGEAQDYNEAEKLIVEDAKLELKENDEDKENWKEKTIEIPELGDFRYFEKEVKFPENIVKETGGVTGYNRKIIDWNSLRDIGLLNTEKNTDIKYHMESLATILKEVTGNDVISQSFIHVFEGDTSIDPQKVFFKKKMILQKIFNPVRSSGEINDSIGFRSLSEYDYKTNNPLSVIINMSNKEVGDLYRVQKRSDINKKNKKLFKIKGSPEWKKLLREIFIKDKKNNKYYISSITNPNFGLSISEKGKGLWKFTGINKEIFFCFGKLNKAFQKYLENLQKIWEQHLLSTEKFEREYFDNADSQIEMIRLQEMVTNRLKYMTNNINALRGIEDFSGLSGDRYFHPRIPFIFNHPQIPELRWCHADYAIMPTKKGLNIIEMITDEENNYKEKEEK